MAYCVPNIGMTTWMYKHREYSEHYGPNVTLPHGASYELVGGSSDVMCKELDYLGVGHIDTDWA